MSAFQKAVKEWLASEKQQEDEEAAVKVAADGTDSESLVLDGKTITKLTDDDTSFLAKFKKLRCLSCIQTGLLTVKGFPCLPNLHVLDLSDNRIAGDLGHLVAMFPNITTLNIGGNKLDNISRLEPLKKLSGLEYLCVEMNPLAESGKHHSEVFKMLPQLVAVDGLDKDGKEVEEKEDEYEDDDEDEDEDGEDTTLKDFYTKDYVGSAADAEEEEEEEGEFAPEGEEDDEEISEEDEDAEEAAAESSPSAPGKRSSSSKPEDGAAKKTRTDEATS
eukprot:GHVS01077351.1.p1 GENE.GHVS01077351.1~~GHVS01077351.1.p1  ORF type:complete len:275 (+),score=89.77 GHVS01077351.1:293-1117(+)